MVDGRTQRGQRNREAIVDALLACYEDGDPAAERRRGRGARRRVGAVGAQPLRRRRGLARRGRAAAVGTVRALVDADRRADRLERDRAAGRATGGVLRSDHAGPARRAAVGRTIRRRSRANLARLDRILRRQLDAVFPELEPDTLDALDVLTSWDTWNRLRTAQGCSVRRARRVLDRNHSHCSKGAPMSAIRPNKDQFLELMNAPDEGPVVMLNLLKFKPSRRTARRCASTPSTASRRADGRGTRRQGAVDGQGRPDAHR